MKNIEMAWKEFNINIDAILVEAKALAPNKILGISADTNMRLHCEDSITEAEVAAIEAYLNGIDDESDEATKYRSQEQVKAAIETLKAGIPSKTWTQLTALERRIILGQMPTAAEMITSGVL